MATSRDARGSAQDAAPKASASEQRLLWNPENVKDVAESVGVASLSEETLRTLSQDVEYRIGQVLVEALRFMRLARRTTMTAKDISLALRVLDVEPLYGYESTRPLRYGEASLGPGQPLFYIDDEEVDFEKLINAPLPKVPRDMMWTGHWLAIEGVQPVTLQNPTSAEARSQDLLHRGPGANPTLAALAGHDNPDFKPQVKHQLSKELQIFFQKVQSILLDDESSAEYQRLRETALAQVSSDPAIQQLAPYFVNFIANEVTHHLDDIFVMRTMMELTNALLLNETIFLAPYASSLVAPVLTCLMARKIGSDTGPNAAKDQYQLREYAASIIGLIAQKYSSSNKLLRPKLTRSCLRNFLSPAMTPQIWYGAICGVLAAGGSEAIKILVLPNLKDFEKNMLLPLQEKGQAGNLDFETLVGGIMKAIQSLAADDYPMMTGVNGTANEREITEIKNFIGEIIGERVGRLGDPQLNHNILDARNFL
ncbi:hypothetical protein F4809DRAFT_399188 [Biscogniauxia mediterranea]|nr:hypothetical protein F4809DRAFT_399188 [Biscogniauxia mediterranea]